MPPFTGHRERLLLSSTEYSHYFFLLSDMHRALLQLLLAGSVTGQAVPRIQAAGDSLTVFVAEVCAGVDAGVRGPPPLHLSKWGGAGGNKDKDTRIRQGI